MGRWPTKAKADAVAADNVSTTLLRIDCVEVEECADCEGYGSIEYYVGSYGTSGCQGPASDTCRACNGTGEV
ncbi:hypothetical protein [Tsuneonella sp. HG222]